MFDVDDGNAGTQIDVQISGLKITGGDENGRGGAILNAENLTITDSIITGNATSDVDGNSGGAIYSDGGALTVERTTFSLNRAGDGGGAILQHNGAATITDSLFRKNTARLSGGAIFNDAGTTSVTNSTFSANTAGYAGGGIFNRNSTATLDRVTITMNTAPAETGSGIASLANSITHTIVHSTIVSGNAHDSDVDFLLGPIDSFSSLGYNLVGRGTATAAFSAVGDQAGVTDAELAPLADNGGPTLTHALIPGGPAVNAGDPADAAGVGAVPLYDQRATDYSRVSDGRIDIGAYERQLPSPAFIVDTLADEMDGDYSAGHFSLREALSLANASTNATEVITFAPALSGGTVYLTLGALPIAHSVIIDGPGAGSFRIDAQLNSRIFEITLSGGVVEIAGLALLDGKSPQFASSNDGGGAIKAETEGTLIVREARITSNSTGGGQRGGGISSSSGNIVVVDSTVSGNVGTSGGGGVYAGSGGVVVLRSTISGNTGGGISAVTARVVESTISGNSFDYYLDGGGGIFASDVTVIDSLVSGNSTAGNYQYGGGIRGYKVTVVDSTISGNSTSAHQAGGGGIYAYAELTIVRSTITNNHANGTGSKGGGLLVPHLEDDFSPHYANVAISGSIISSNSAAGGNPDLDPGLDDMPGQSTLDMDYTIIGNTTDLTNQQLLDIFAGAGNLLNVNPLLGPLADNGGRLMTHALLSGSPAIDNGDPAAAAGVDGVSRYDQRGFPFSRVYGGRIDIGPYERQSLALVVDTLADENDGDYSPGHFSLREAIDLTNDHVGVADAISFSPALGGGTIGLELGELVITDAVTINGPGASLLTIQAYDPTPAMKNGDGQRIFNINDQTATQQPVTISGLTLTGADLDNKGGAILSTENLTVVDSILTGNFTKDLNGNSGGAIYNDGGTLSVNRTTLSNNHGGDGGGAILNHSGSATIANSLFEQNSTRFSGGGIFNDGGFMKVSDSTLSNNTAGYAGGGLFTRNNVATLTSVTITGNTAPAAPAAALPTRAMAQRRPM